MNIFNLLRIYAGSWSVKSSRAFTDAEIEAVDSATVVASEYGNSVCFHLKAGGMSFIPLSNDSTKGIGESVDLRSAQVLTLEKQGEADIVRVKC